MKHRKAESAHEKGGLIASIGQTLAGPRFYETDEVSFRCLSKDTYDLGSHSDYNTPVVR